MVSARSTARNGFATRVPGDLKVAVTKARAARLRRQALQELEARALGKVEEMRYNARHD
jgi:hypothetical protein